MRLLHALSETALGRALIAYFFDLPRWTLANMLFAVALAPAYLALASEQLTVAAAATLPVVPVAAGMINMAASQTAAKAPRLRDAFAYPATLITVFVVWAVTAAFATVVLAGVTPVVVFVTGIVFLSVLLIGVFAIFLPSQLQVEGMLVGRNALVLAVSNPIIGLGMLALAGIGVWAVWVSKGALIVVVPALWVLLAAFAVDDRIKAIRSAQNRVV